MNKAEWEAEYFQRVLPNSNFYSCQTPPPCTPASPQIPRRGRFLHWRVAFVRTMSAPSSSHRGLLAGRRATDVKRNSCWIPLTARCCRPTLLVLTTRQLLDSPAVCAEGVWVTAAINDRGAIDGLSVPKASTPRFCGTVLLAHFSVQSRSSLQALFFCFFYLLPGMLREAVYSSRLLAIICRLLLDVGFLLPLRGSWCFLKWLHVVCRKLPLRLLRTLPAACLFCFLSSSVCCRLCLIALPLWGCVIVRGRLRSAVFRFSDRTTL